VTAGVNIAVVHVDSGDKLTVCDKRADGLTVQVYVVHAGGTKRASDLDSGYFGMIL
jgi:hypothetical protein